MHARTSLVSAAFLVLTLACSSDEEPSGPPRIDEVRITTAQGASSAEIERGKTVQLQARALRNGSEVPDIQFQWRSEAPAIATVSSTGLVQGVEIGTATILAEPVGAVGPAGSMTVSVVGPAVARIDISPANAWVDIDDTLTLRAIPRDAAGAQLTGVEVTWRTNSAALTVEPTGRVRGVTPGTAEVEAEASGVKGTASVRVTPVTGLAPDTGRYGGVMTIQGAGLPAGISRVEFTRASGGGRVPAFIRSASATAVEVWVPAESGSGPIWLKTSTDSFPTSRRFTVTANDDIFEGGDCEGAGICVYLVPVPYHNPSLLVALNDRDNIGFELETASPISIHLVDRGARNSSDVIGAFVVRTGPLGVAANMLAANFVVREYVDSVVYSHPNLPPGLYFVQVYGLNLTNNGSVRRAYGLTITTSAQFEIGPDPLEPNDTPREAAAAPITLPFDRADLALENPYSVDNYVFTVSEPTTITVNLTGEGGNPNLRLIRGDSIDIFQSGVEIIASSTTPDPVESLQATVQPGSYTVVVDEFDGQAGTYRLQITATPASQAGPFTLSAPVPPAVPMRGLPLFPGRLDRRAIVPVRVRER